LLHKSPQRKILDELQSKQFNAKLLNSIIIRKIEKNQTFAEIRLRPKPEPVEEK